jgi:hypothetical protein
VLAGQVFYSPEKQRLSKQPWQLENESSSRISLSGAKNRGEDFIVRDFLFFALFGEWLHGNASWE